MAKQRKAAKTWNCNKLSRNVFKVTVPFKQNKDWEFWFLLTADQHWDNPKSNLKLQEEHLKQARERNAAVMSAGDYFCLMQGKYDKRSNKAALRPEHQTDNYFDSVISTAADWLEPYADLYTVIATGNHEEAVNNRHETNIIERFTGVLSDRTGHSVYNGGYSGYIVFSFKGPGRNEREKQTQTVVLRYEHGAGGAAPVTGGVIDAHRRGLYYPDADIMVSGHNHNSWMVEYARQRVSRKTGNLHHDVQTHIKAPSYKNGFGDGFSSWEATRGMPPKPEGAYWIRFYMKRAKDRNRIGEVVYDVIKAN